MKSPHKENSFKKHALLYIGIQVVLWAKVALFFYLYGKGVLLQVIEPFYTFAPILMPGIFASPLLVADWAFHQLIHLSLAVMIFLFARRAPAPKIVQVIPIVLVADILHNVGYWFTNTFATTLDLVVDFGEDFFLFIVFYYLFAYAHKRYKWFGKLLPEKW